MSSSYRRNSQNLLFPKDLQKSFIYGRPPQVYQQKTFTKTVCRNPSNYWPNSVMRKAEIHLSTIKTVRQKKIFYNSIFVEHKLGLSK